jgi:Ca2+-binding RTX toxin-like protein
MWHIKTKGTRTMSKLPTINRVITYQLALAFTVASLLAASALPAFAQATCRGLPVTVNLARGDLPTNSDDVILGTGGNDVILALGGNDTICAGDGNDEIHGNAGDDNIVGSTGDDEIYGGDGNDTLAGNDGADHIEGGNGDDQINCGVDTHYDYADGGPNFDTLGPNHDCELQLNIP